MEYTERFQEIMWNYAEAVQAVQQKRKLFDGVFGLGNHPGSAPCHDAMDTAVADLCREAAETGNTEEMAGLTESILRTERTWDGPQYARLMTAAIQRHTLALIPKLDPGDRQRLAAWYKKEYPRSKRLPVQDQVLDALMK